MKKRLLSLVLAISLTLSMFTFPVAIAAEPYVVNTTGFSTYYTQDFSGITNDNAGKAVLSDFWDLQDGSFGTASTTSIVGGALRFFWSAGRQMTTKDVFKQSITSFDAKLDAAVSPAVGQDIKGFAIRQIRNDGCFQSENDKYGTGSQPGLDGILFRLSADGITVVVDDTTVPASVNAGIIIEADKTTSWSTNSTILLPAGVSLSSFQKITVVDKGTTINLVIGDVLLATIELSNLVGGVYKTAVIKNAAGDTLASTTTANVPENGRIAFGKRTGDMDIDNINIMTNAPTVPRDRDIVSFSLATAQPIELSATGSVGQTFTAAKQFNTITIAACTWSSANAGFTLDLRKDGPTGQIVFRHAYSNIADNSNPLYAVGNLPAGIYYLELNTLVSSSEATIAEPDKISHMGVWASSTGENPYIGGTAYFDGTVKSFDINFGVKYLLSNTVSVGNEYVAPPYVADTTGFTSYYTQDFSSITNDETGKNTLNEFWELQDGSFGTASTSSIVDGALRFVWAAGREIISRDIFQQSITSVDVKVDGAAGPATSNDIKAIAIRQIENDGCFSSENDKYGDGTQPGKAGVLFRLSSNAITVVVDDTIVPAYVNEGITVEANKTTSWNINSTIFLPASISLSSAFETITVVDKGTTIELIAGDVLLAKIELGNLVNGVYTSAIIKDAVGNTLNSTSTANVPQNGKIAFGKRTNEIDIDNISIMTNAPTVRVDKDLINFGLSAQQPIGLAADGSIGQTFTAVTPFNTISLSVCTWSTAKGGYTFDLRIGSPTGQIVYRQAATNAVDGSNPAYVVGDLPAGTYYLELNNLVVSSEPTETDANYVSQVGVWASNTGVNPHNGGTAYLNGTSQSYDIRFGVKFVAANAAAVGNEYRGEPYVIDTTGFTSTYTQDFSTITNDAAGKTAILSFWDISDENAFGTPPNGNYVKPDGSLHFAWIEGRGMYSKAIFGKNITSFDVKTEGISSGAINAVIQAFGVRQISNSGLFQNENDTDPIVGAHAGVDGIIFELDSAGVTVIVDDTTVPADKTGATSWNIASRILLPVGLTFSDFEKVTVVDKGTVIELVVADYLLAKIELSNLVDGVYKTAIIKDAAGTTLASTTTANVPETGKIGFGVRSWAMDIDNINVMTEDSAEPVELDKTLITFNVAPAQPIALTASGKIGQTFIATEQFNTISLGICTWSTVKAGYTFVLRNDSPTGAVVFRHAYSDALDNSNPLYVVGNLPAGTYYLEINSLVASPEPTEEIPGNLSQMGVWASKDGENLNPYVDGTAYLDGSAMTYDISFSVKYIVTNAAAVGNEYVPGENENPGTSDLGAIQIAVMAVASAVVALKRRKESV